MNKVYLSVVIPVFNEEGRVENIIGIDKALRKLSSSTEMVVVNDGSTDKTLDILKNISVKQPLRIKTYKQNMGKGYAVKRGMLAARGRYRLFMDIDLSTSLSEIPRILKEIEKGYDIVIGSRKIEGAKVTDHQSLIRESLGKFFTFLSRRFLGVGVGDFTCGFKIFTESVSQKVFEKSTIPRWGFDSEILFIAVKYGFKIKELPVEWKNNPLTKVRFPRDLVGSFVELLKIRVNYWRGYYR